MALVVTEVSSDTTHDLRHRVLRAGRPRSSCVWEGDDLPTTHHYALCDEDGGSPLAIVSLFKRPAPHRPHVMAWQGRGMAVAPEFQGHGLGRRLLQGALALLPAADGGDGLWIWCNARTSAAGFYVNEGFVQVGDVFDIPQVGPHVVMERQR